MAYVENQTTEFKQEYILIVSLQKGTSSMTQIVITSVI